jgi:isopentenyl phosphate kinase
MIDETFYLLYLDDYHAGDSLFLQSLARALVRRAGATCLIAHGSGEHAERMLEAEGLFLKRSSGLLPISTAAEHRIVERAIEEINRKIVKLLADAVVPAVGIVGNRRRLLTIRNGMVEAPNIQWVQKLASDSVVPVISAYASDAESDRTGEVPLSDAVVALAEALLAVRSDVVFFSKGRLPALEGDHIIYDEIAASAADPVGLKSVLDAGIPSIITTTPQFSESGELRGLRVTPG